MGDHLIDSNNEAFDKGKTSISQRRGIISLIPKGETELSGRINRMLLFFATCIYSAQLINARHNNLHV